MTSTEQRARPTIESPRGLKNRAGRVRSLLVGTAVGLGVGLLGSIAYAAIPGTGGMISGCVTSAEFRGQHGLTLLDTAQSTVCQAGQTLITWNQTGPTGPQGPKGDIGPQGPAGASATARWATINADGTLAHGADTVTFAGHATVPVVAGTYVVHFDRDVSQCALLATLGRTQFGSLSANIPLGEIAVMPVSGTTSVVIWTSTGNGTLADMPFHVAVFC